MTSHNDLPYATPTRDSYGRTDGRTNGESYSPTRDNPPSVTHTRTYGDLVLGECLIEAVEALTMARERLGSPRNGEQREEIHPWTRRAIYWRDGNRCGWCNRGFDHGMLVLDHIRPWADGGSDLSDNLRTLCVPCNDDRSNYATDAYTRVLPVGLCDYCHTHPRYRPGQVRPVMVGELDPGSTFRCAIFCGRCGRSESTTDRRRVL